jgi:hypothetical protein
VYKPTANRALLAALAFASVMSLAGCAAERNPLEHSPAHAACCTELGGTSAGFWLGIWHGTISPVTFFVSLFKSSIGVYEVHNNGGWYNFGFFLGLTSVLGGSGGAYSRTRRDE